MRWMKYLPLVIISPLSFGQTAIAQETPSDQSKLADRLLEPSELDTLGHPVNVKAFLQGLSHKSLWNFSFRVDDARLRREGIDMSTIVVPKWFTSGVTPRSALRMILHNHGLGFVQLDSAELLVTTRQQAERMWWEEIGELDLDEFSATSVSVRRNAVFAAGFANQDEDKLNELLKRALMDSDKTVRFDAAYALAVSRSDDSIPHLLALMRCGDRTLQQAAAYALGDHGSQATIELLEIVGNSDTKLSDAAVFALKRQGRVAKVAIPRLLAEGVRLERLDTTSAEEVEGCRMIANAVAQIDITGALPALRKMLRSSNAGERAFAARCLAEAADAAGECESELRSGLKDSDTSVRRQCTRALAQIDRLGDETIDALQFARTDSDHFVRLWATSAIRLSKSASENK